MMMNPFRAVSKKVVDATLATEVKRLREVVVQQETAINQQLAREVTYLNAFSELCEQQVILDNNGQRLASLSAFQDFANARAKVVSDAETK
jgi:hypothetical protein